MYALLRLHFDLQKKTLLFVLVALFVILILMFNSIMIPTNLPVLTFILSMNLSNSSTFLSNKNFYYILHTMPIKREHIVKSSAFFSSLIIIIFFAIPLPFQIRFGIANEELQEYLAIFTGFFSSSLLVNVVQHYFIFTNEKLEIHSTENILAVFGSITFVIVPHAIICLSGSEETFYIRMMIMPLITCLLCYVILKKTIKHYNNKEIM